MNRNLIRCYIVLVMVFVMYNVVAFSLPFPKNSVFLISYLFTLAAIGVQIYVIQTAFYRGADVKSKFYGFPIARIGILYLITQIILGLLFMFAGSLVYFWIPLIIYTLLLGCSILGLITAEFVRDEIVFQDIKLKKDVSCLRNLQSKTSFMISLARNEEIATMLKRFAEDLRFSDPVSNESLQEVENRLVDCVDEIEEAVTTGRSYESISILCQKANSLLAERNEKCKCCKSH